MNSYPAEFSRLMSLGVRPAGIASVWLRFAPQASTNINIEMKPEQILSVTCVDEVDPLSRTLPTESVTVEIIDFDGTLDPDNPRASKLYYGRYYMIDIRLGLESDTSPDTTIMGPELHYFSTRVPTYLNGILKFTGTRLFGVMLDSYTNMPVQVSDMLELTKSVFSQVGIASSEYSIPSGLTSRGVDLGAMLPIASCTNTLLTIANQCGYQLRTNSSGQVQMSYELYSNLTPTLITSRDILETPSVETIPLVRDIIIDISNVKNKTLVSSEMEEIGSLVGLYATGVTHHEFVEFTSCPYLPNGAWPPDISYGIVNGTITHAEIYRLGAYVDFTVTSSEKEVEITFKSRTVSQYNMCRVFHVNNNGEDEQISNPLENGSWHISSLAQMHGEYLNDNRRTYTISYRGDPQIEVMDIIRVQLPYYGVIECLVLRTELTLSTSYTGILLVKPIEKLKGKIASAIAGQAVAGQAIAGVRLYKGELGGTT